MLKVVSMEFEIAVGYLLNHTAATLQRQADHLLTREFSIGMAQFKLLMILQRSHQLQQHELAERLGQTEASVSRQIKLLVERGLLYTEVDTHNRRRHWTTVTTEGAALTKQAETLLHEYIAPAFDSLNKTEREQLLKSLRALHDYACSGGKLFACDHPFDKVI